MFLVLDAISMIKDIRSKGGAIDLWGKALNIPQLIGGLIFVTTIEGQMILAMLIVTLVVAGQIHKRTPFSRLIGICHLPWIILLPWLVVRLDTIDYSTGMRFWLYYVSVTIAVSLVLDVMEVFRYVKGEKSYTWSQRS